MVTSFFCKQEVDDDHRKRQLARHEIPKGWILLRACLLLVLLSSRDFDQRLCVRRTDQRNKCGCSFAGWYADSELLNLLALVLRHSIGNRSNSTLIAQLRGSAHVYSFCNLQEMQDDQQKQLKDMKENIGYYQKKAQELEVPHANNLHFSLDLIDNSSRSGLNVINPVEFLK